MLEIRTSSRESWITCEGDMLVIVGVLVVDGVAETDCAVARRALLKTVAIATTVHIVIMTGADNGRTGLQEARATQRRRGTRYSSGDGRHYANILFMYEPLSIRKVQHSLTHLIVKSSTRFKKHFKATVPHGKIHGGEQDLLLSL